MLPRIMACTRKQDSVTLGGWGSEGEVHPRGAIQRYLNEMGTQKRTSMKRCRQSESLVEYSVTVGRPPAGADAARFLLDSRDARRVSPRPMLYCDRFRSDSSSCAAQQHYVNRPALGAPTLEGVRATQDVHVYCKACMLWMMIEAHLVLWSGHADRGFVGGCCIPCCSSPAQPDALEGNTAQKCLPAHCRPPSALSRHTCTADEHAEWEPLPFPHLVIYMHLPASLGLQTTHRSRPETNLRHMLQDDPDRGHVKMAR